MTVSVFGYPALDQYAIALLRTAHTDGLRRDFQRDIDTHNDRMRRYAADPMFVKRIVGVYDFASTDRGYAQRLNEGKRIGNLGWYFEHPIIREYLPQHVLDWVDTNCLPISPIYGDVSPTAGTDH